MNPRRFFIPPLPVNTSITLDGNRPKRRIETLNSNLESAGLRQLYRKDFYCGSAGSQDSRLRDISSTDLHTREKVINSTLRPLSRYALSARLMSASRSMNVLLGLKHI